MEIPNDDMVRKDNLERKYKVIIVDKKHWKRGFLVTANYELGYMYSSSERVLGYLQ